MVVRFTVNSADGKLSYNTTPIQNNQSTLCRKQSINKRRGGVYSKIMREALGATYLIYIIQTITIPSQQKRDTFEL